MSWFGEGEKHVVDVIVASTSVGAFLTQNLPTVAVGLTVIWTALRIYETDTIQSILGGKKDGKETNDD